MAYNVFLNGLLVRFGSVSFSNEMQEETFVHQMEQEYMSDDSDIVETIFY